MECGPLPRVSMSASPVDAAAAAEAEVASAALRASRPETLLLMDSSAPMAVAGPGPLSPATVIRGESRPPVMGRGGGLGMEDGVVAGAPSAGQAVLWLCVCVWGGGNVIG